jgi:hypothetical protein
MTSIEIIEKLYSAGANSKKELLDALEDGLTLKTFGITEQYEVDQAYSIVYDSDIDEHLADGGTIGNYQW